MTPQQDHSGARKPHPEEEGRQLAKPGGGDPPAGERLRKHEERFGRFLWVHYAVTLLGLWLLVSPVTFGYDAAVFAWNDAISGALLVVLGCFSLSPRRLWAPWAAFGVGAWLNFAPLVLWAPEASIYINNSVVGILVVALTVLIPDVPGSELFRKAGPEIPPGWSYNPSSWVQRMPLVVLAVGGWFISRYLAAFQLGYSDWAWDPLFGEGTVRVLTSEVSEAFPVSDAGLGAFAYTFETLLAFMGMKDRWRSNPSTVLVFGLLVVPLGVTHLVLVTLMPVLVGYWCTFCLLVAALMLIMVPLAMGEIVATGQFIRTEMRQGRPLWKILAQGGGLPGNEEDPRTPPPNAPLRETLPAMAWGVTLPWTLAVSTALGVWLMIAPALLSTDGAAANSHFLTGALVITVSVVALGEVVRACRFLNIPLGLWTVISPWMLSGATGADTANGAIVGLLLIVLSLPRGRIRERYGSWERWIV